MYKHVHIVCIIGVQMVVEMHPERIKHKCTDGFQIRMQDLMGLSFLKGVVYMLELSCLSRWEWAASGLTTEDGRNSKTMRAFDLDVFSFSSG